MWSALQFFLESTQWGLFGFSVHFDVTCCQVADIAPDTPTFGGFARKKAVADALNAAPDKIVFGTHHAIVHGVNGDCPCLPRDFQHAVESDAGMLSNIEGNGNLIYDAPFEQIFHRPEKMRRIDSEHRGAKASAVIQRDDESIRIFLHQTIDEMNLGPYRPHRSRRRLRHAFNDVLGGTDIIG